MKRRILRMFCLAILMTGLIWQGKLILKNGNAPLQIIPTVVSTENQGEKVVEALPDLSAEISAILQANRGFYEGYSVDESFLLWFDHNYGSQTLTTIAYEALAGASDSQIWYDATGKSMHVLWLEYCEFLTYSTYLFTNVHYMDTASSDTIYMDFIGDVNFDEDWGTTQALDASGGNLDYCISRGVQDELRSADLAMMNNEFTYSTQGQPLAGKSYTFRANPSRVKYLEDMGIDLVNLANNHVWDYGEGALLDTLEVLEEAGVDYVGAGRDLEEASAVQYYIMNGKKIAIVSATQIEKSYKYTKEATSSMAGVLKTLNPDKYVEVIKTARENSDYVICNVHWGAEAVLYIMADQRELAKQFIDAGADIVIGNHSHRLQGMSYVEGVPVIHSLGNFWFCNGKLYTTILQVSIDKKGELGVRFIPCMMDGYRTYLIQDDTEIDQFYKYICDLSEGIALDGKGRAYSTLDADADKETLAHLPYHSAKRYANHSGGKDLDGRTINIVGDK